jgi:hypothetical protein
MTSTEARAWMRSHYHQFVKADERGQMTRPTNSGLKRIIRDPRTPSGVRRHVYSWLLYRRHRGFAN